MEEEEEEKGGKDRLNLQFLDFFDFGVGGRGGGVVSEGWGEGCGCRVVVKG